MSSQEMKALSSIVDRLSYQLTIDDYLRLRRGMALVEGWDEPPTKPSNALPQPIESDPQKMTVSNWPANDDEVSL